MGPISGKKGEKSLSLSLIRGKKGKGEHSGLGRKEEVGGGKGARPW